MYVLLLSCLVNCYYSEFYLHSWSKWLKQLATRLGPELGQIVDSVFVFEMESITVAPEEDVVFSQADTGSYHNPSDWFSPLSLTVNRIPFHLNSTSCTPARLKYLLDQSLKQATHIYPHQNRSKDFQTKSSLNSHIKPHRLWEPRICDILNRPDQNLSIDGKSYGNWLETKQDVVFDDERWDVESCRLTTIFASTTQCRLHLARYHHLSLKNRTPYSIDSIEMKSGKVKRYSNRKTKEWED